ncbi:MAG: excalibur calcium-binding domain-containing protein [Actinomycetota bacterium]|nr:excalibur calcium-binding domain-containing protein [Actinomycetota bacterium]
MKVLGAIIGLLMLVAASGNLTSRGGTQQVSKPAAPAAVSMPTPSSTTTTIPRPPVVPAQAVRQPAPKSAAPEAAPKPPAAPKQLARKAPAAPAPAPAAKMYANCSEAKAAGAAPLRRGETGYSSSLDRDGDGIACEK